MCQLLCDLDFWLILGCWFQEEILDETDEYVNIHNK